MKKEYRYPIVEVSMCVRTSVLCASGASGDPTVPVNTNPLNDTTIE